jgi:cytochrome c peroxidase
MAKVNLGQALFWDEQLSSTRSVACATCHIVDAGGHDPRLTIGSFSTTNPGPDTTYGTPDDITGSPGLPLSDASGLYVLEPTFGIDVQVTPRKAPSVLNAAYAPRLFWDGRAGPVFRDPISGAIVLGGGAALESQVLGPPLATAEMAHSASRSRRPWRSRRRCRPPSTPGLPVVTTTRSSRRPSAVRV